MEEELNQEPQPLTKRERKKLAKEQKRDERERDEVIKRLRNWGIGLLVIIGLFGGVWWLMRESTKPLPGQEVADLGREHTTDIAGIIYNSNPPTSGTHFPMWAKKGVYDRVLSDGYLLHSLEHGYVILSYDCTKEISNFQFPISNVYAHEEPTRDASDSGELLKHMKVQGNAEMSWFTPENSPEDEVGLPSEFSSEECKALVSNLSKFVDKWDRVVIVPRPGMDTSIALTAWTRIDKLESFDENRIEEFIKAFHNRGPEKTIE